MDWFLYDNGLRHKRVNHEACVFYNMPHAFLPLVFFKLLLARDFLNFEKTYVKKNVCKFKVSKYRRRHETGQPESRMSEIFCSIKKVHS